MLQRSRKLSLGTYAKAYLFVAAEGIGGGSSLWMTKERLPSVGPNVHTVAAPVGSKAVRHMLVLEEWALLWEGRLRAFIHVAGPNTEDGSLQLLNRAFGALLRIYVFGSFHR